MFDYDYQLRSLHEVREHIDEHGHLPGVPSAREVEERAGLDLADTNRILLEKIEELTLYTLEQQQQLDELRATVSQLEKRK